MDGKRAGLALALALVVSCGGSAPSTGGAATSSPGGAATSTPAGAATSTTAARTTTPPAGPQLAEILTAAKVSQYKITYKITATGAGADAMSGDQTWYLKPPRSRFDFTTVQGGQKQTMSIFSLPDGTFMCFAQSGTTTCLATPATGSPLEQNAAVTTQRSLIDSPGSFGATFTGSRTIAGQPGLCYDVKAAAAAAGGFTTGTFCYTREGLALLSQFAVQGSTWSMEATSVSLTVPDSDFVLPAKPTSFGQP